MKPVIHFTAPHYWINDPNGLIYYKGEYHLFYQHFPYAPQWGTMHWGHATTKDFINFNHLPIALYPSKDYDRNGCFSGSAINLDGKMYLYYTSIKYAKENPEYIHVQFSDDDLIASQSLLISNDGYHFDNEHDKQKIIDVITDESIGDVKHTRDPKVWIGKNNHIYMIVGSKSDHKGKVLFYESSNGINFKLINQYSDHSIGDMWECPDLFEVNHQHIMVFSPEHINKPPQPVSNAVYMPITFDEETCTISDHQDYQYLDYGLDFYAPQTFLDENNQRVMIGWMRMREPVQGDDWVGMFTMPRILEYKDNHLFQHVHPLVESQFIESNDTITLDEPFKLSFTMNKESYLNFGGFELSIKEDCLCGNREAVSIKHDKVCNVCQTPQLSGQYNIELYYDHHIFEIFINGGEYVMSQIVYDLKNDVIINKIDDLKLFKIKFDKG